nr:MAG TPA_asm: hypothetical protein [Caudoviricetes sp.]
MGAILLQAKAQKCPLAITHKTKPAHRRAGCDMSRLKNRRGRCRPLDILN